MNSGNLYPLPQAYCYLSLSGTDHYACTITKQPALFVRNALRSIVCKPIRLIYSKLIVSFYIYTKCNITIYFVFLQSKNWKIRKTNWWLIRLNIILHCNCIAAHNGIEVQLVFRVFCVFVAFYWKGKDQ